MANMERDMKVTDEILWAALEAFGYKAPTTLEGHLADTILPRMQAALGAAFASLHSNTSNESSPQCNADKPADLKGANSPQLEPEDSPINVLCAEGGLMHECRMDDKICIFCGKDLSKKVEPEEKQDGWIEWKSLEPDCSPDLSPDILVEAQYGGGQIIVGSVRAFIWYWNNDGGFGDIIAYRIISKEKKACICKQAKPGQAVLVNNMRET